MPAPLFHGRTMKRGDAISWVPWFPVPEIDELTPEQRESLQPVQVRSSYYRLLSLDPGIFWQRTKVDTSIFHAREGLARGDREVCAAVSSVVNGCPVCATTHVNFAGKFSKRPDDVDRLLTEGLEADYGVRWNAMINAATGIAAVEPSVTQLDMDSLRGSGFSEDEILDVVHSTAFFAWANRLLLTLGDSRFHDEADA